MPELGVWLSCKRNLAWMQKALGLIPSTIRQLQMMDLSTGFINQHGNCGLGASCEQRQHDTAQVIGQDQWGSSVAVTWRLEERSLD